MLPPGSASRGQWMITKKLSQAKGILALYRPIAPPPPSLCFTKNSYSSHSSVRVEVTKVVPIVERALFFIVAMLCDAACICMRLLCLRTVLTHIWHCRLCFNCWIFALWPSVQPSTAYLTQSSIQFWPQCSLHLKLEFPGANTTYALARPRLVV